MLAEDVVGIVRMLLAAPGADADRHCESQRDEIREDVKFRGFEGVLGVVGTNQLAGGLDRLLVTDDLVGDQHRDVVDQRCVHHVAEVDDAADAFAVAHGHQHIIRVAVVVNDLRAQAAEPRKALPPVPLENALH